MILSSMKLEKWVGGASNLGSIRKKCMKAQLRVVQSASPSSYKLSLKYKLQLIQLITNKLGVLDQHIWRTRGENTVHLRIDCYNNKDSWAAQTTFTIKVWKFVMRKHPTGIVCLYNICMCTPNQYTVEWRPLHWKYELFNIGQVQFGQ